MNKIKEMITEGDTRSLGILIVMIAYVVVMYTTLTSGATNEIEGYIQTVPIQIQDGSEETKDYLVKQDKVSNVLDQVNIELTSKDIVNKELDYIVHKNDLLAITRVENQIIEEINTIASKEVIDYNGLNLFTTQVISQGQDGQVRNEFDITYQNGKEVSRQLVNSEVLTQVSDTVVSVGSVQPGAYFSGKLTTYGGDCNGCYGMSASGVSLSPTTGVNYTNTGKLNYNGGSYYALAADPSIPFGTIIEIKNHNLSIEGTAYGIVVDRGGAIKGNKIDIFKGSQTGGTTYFSGGTSNNTQFKIVSVGSGRNFWK